MAQVLSREERGRAIAERPNQIVILSERFFKVASQSSDRMYDVTKKRKGGWLCTCPDFQYRNVVCKHIWAIQIKLTVREISPIVIEPIIFDACIYCRSKEIIRWGVRKNKYGGIQRFACKACGKSFTVNLGFERMKHDPQGVTAAMQLYFSGESLRNTARSLHMIGVYVSYKTVYLWIRKYTELMERYLVTVQPKSRTLGEPTKCFSR